VNKSFHIIIKGLFGSTEEEGRCGEGFLRMRGEVKHNLLC
jgi:hypothetical protein